MGPATTDTKSHPSHVRLHLPAGDGVNETPSRLVVGNPLAAAVQSQASVARNAHADWAALPLRRRLKILKRLRLQIAADPLALARCVDRENAAETLAAEVLPLLDACRFLETEAARILREQTVGKRARPMWLWGNSVVLRPEPWGVVLIIAPANYPLMLPGIQTLQAIAAGNAVLIKPAPNCSRAIQTLISRAESAGLPAGLVQALPECSAAAVEAIRSGVDKAFLTGSANTGRAVSRELAESLTPSVMELSGCDAAFVLEDADLNLVSDCLLFGLTLNASQTCMAPRRVFANSRQTDQLLRLLKDKLDARTAGRDQRSFGSPLNPSDGPRSAPCDVTARRNSAQERAFSFAATMIQEALSRGAQLVGRSVAHAGQGDLSGAVVLDRVTSDMSIAQADVFAPVLSFIRVESEEQALQENSRCPYALSATVFGPVARCQQFARRIPAGCVVVNDIIAPTADPRVPFGGRGLSGHGMTRGAAGLLEMTQLKAIVTTRRWFKPHLQSPTAADTDVLVQLIRLEHSANPRQSLMAAPKMLRATWEAMRIRRSQRRQIARREPL